MSRRILSVLVAALMLFSLLPATAAFAQATATADIAAASRVVFPGDRTYTVTVRNTEAALIGRAINAVQVWLPAAAANVSLKGTPTAPSGWTAQAQSFSGGTTQFVTYKTTGQGIAPGSTLAFSVPTTVGQPARSDLVGDFIVKVSSTGFNTATNATPTSAGALTTAVEVLEILQGTVRPIAPTNADNSKGVTDRSGTGGAAGQNGQTITYAFDVKNHAKEAINVAGSLSTTDPVDKPGPAMTQSVAPNGGTATFQVPVTLGPAPTANRNVNMIANAVGPRADAASRQDSFTVQSPVRLDLSDLRPTRVRSGFGSAREFTVNAAKTGSQAFDLTSGALTFGPNTIPLANPQTFGTGLRTATLRYPTEEISGADNDYNASASSVGQDDNLANYSLNSALGLITIDNLIPDITLDLPVLGNAGKDADGDELAAAADGTTITVSGVAVGTDDLDEGTIQVELRPDAGDPIAVPVTGSYNEDGAFEFSGSVSPDWDQTATRFAAAARIADDAGNIGTDQSGSKLIDLFAPVLDPQSGVVQTPRTIRVQFDDATGLRGACDPAMWSVQVGGRPGPSVSDVHTSEGLTCSGDSDEAEARRRALSTDGVRVLVLSADLGVDDQPRVTYTKSAGTLDRTLGRYPAKDGARNDAATQFIDAATRLVPRVPDLTDIRRPDHETGAAEEATFDAEEGRYFTNIGGEDAITVTVGGVRPGYIIQIVDGNGNVLDEEEGVRPTILSPLATEWQQEVTIPLGTTDGTYTRGVRLLSTTSGNFGDPALLSIVLDTVTPIIDDAVMTAPAEALAYFDEKIIRVPEDDPNSPDTVENWFVRWNMQREDDTVEVRSNVDDVVPVPDQPTVWRLTLPGEINDTNFRGLDWAWIDQTAKRYEDRAGNYMLNSFQ